MDIWIMTREQARALVGSRYNSDCVWTTTGGRKHRCPLYARCQTLINTDELLMCELSDLEAHVPERTNNDHHDTKWNRDEAA